jgi:hypothetical protein
VAVAVRLALESIHLEAEKPEGALRVRNRF